MLENRFPIGHTHTVEVSSVADGGVRVASTDTEVNANYLLQERYEQTYESLPQAETNKKRWIRDMGWVTRGSATTFALSSLGLTAEVIAGANDRPSLTTAMLLALTAFASLGAGVKANDSRGYNVRELEAIQEARVVFEASGQTKFRKDFKIR